MSDSIYISDFQTVASASPFTKCQSFHSVQTLESSGRSGKDKRGRKDKNGFGPDIGRIDLGKKGSGIGVKDGKGAGSGLVCPSCNSPFVQLESFEGTFSLLSV